MAFLQRGACAFAFLASLAAAAAAAAAAADVVVRIEAVPQPAFDDAFNVSNIASDGTVVGTTGMHSRVVRWRPGAAAEDLGMGQFFSMLNVTPLVARGGSVVVATEVFFDAAGRRVEAPVVWTGGTQREPIAGRVLDESSAYGISDDGTRLAGVGGMTGAVYSQPWVWSAPTGQVLLTPLPGRVHSEAWGVSNDGRVVVGFADDRQAGLTRYGVVWVDGNPTPLVDAEQQPLSQATACNSDCSVIVGAGFGLGGPGSPQAWRKTAHGVEYLGEVAGAQPGMPHYAMDTSEDGSLIAGIYAEVVFDVHGDAYFVNRAFLWNPDEGIVDLVAWLAARGIDYGADFREMAVISMTRDGSRLLTVGRDADNVPLAAVVRIDPETIFADRFG